MAGCSATAAAAQTLTLALEPGQRSIVINGSPQPLAAGNYSVRAELTARNTRVPMQVTTPAMVPADSAEVGSDRRPRGAGRAPDWPMWRPRTRDSDGPNACGSRSRSRPTDSPAAAGSCTGARVGVRGSQEECGVWGPVHGPVAPTIGSREPRALPAGRPARASGRKAEPGPSQNLQEPGCAPPAGRPHRTHRSLMKGSAPSSAWRSTARAGCHKVVTSAFSLVGS